MQNTIKKPSHANTLYLVQLAMFVAIELIFCFTPLGSIPISPGIVATLAHIPAIVAAIILGYNAALIVGATMGLSALYIWTFTPPVPVVAFAFTPFAPNGSIWSLIICLVPRILFPLVTVWLFKTLKDRGPVVLRAVIAAIGGTFVHSALVLSIIYLAFNKSEVVGGNYIKFIIAWGGVNAILEIVIAGVIAGAIIIPLIKINANKS